MLSRCANPDCQAKFLYFTSGKLIALIRNKSNRIEYVWFCSACAVEYERLSRSLQTKQGADCELRAVS